MLSKFIQKFSVKDLRKCERIEKLEQKKPAANDKIQT